MASEDTTGFTINRARLSFLLSIIALLGVVWQTVSYAKTQEFRIAQNTQMIVAKDEQITELKADVKDVKAQLQKMTSVVSELVFVIKSNNPNKVPFVPFDPESK